MHRTGPTVEFHPKAPERPSEDFSIAYARFILTARDIMRSLEGGPAACFRGKCRRSGTCRNESDGRVCAKKLSPSAEKVVSLMMLFALRLDPFDIWAFYYGEEIFAYRFRPGPMTFDAEARAMLWPLTPAEG